MYTARTKLFPLSSLTVSLVPESTLKILPVANFKGLWSALLIGVALGRIAVAKDESLIFSID
ncbi:hypothetical protein DK873_07905 [Lactobacillus melliventris]|uniref:Uncharacterized protein n=1 Tax=Lactobacillus melliventris TaxID=1218507 RepID=A0ABX5N2P9_9LACO|nr:hypothetical protein DK873_07905 [Lactobacillus melliventris]